ncbi:hypothetical protein EYF80_020372 [Liparis tanakae]|uniref:Uncharacterized protein n=1 Tax=Liparis tanakae TaxID=230148 RepID=A0A4Z2HUX3_9TELE|nr:hypothetical protein EYF80_020372 [Liparis tanakae]
MVSGEKMVRRGIVTEGKGKIREGEDEKERERGEKINDGRRALERQLLPHSGSVSPERGFDL